MRDKSSSRRGGGLGSMLLCRRMWRSVRSVVVARSGRSISCCCCSSHLSCLCPSGLPLWGWLGLCVHGRFLAAAAAAVVVVVLLTLLLCLASCAHLAVGLPHQQPSSARPFAPHCGCGNALQDACLTNPTLVQIQSGKLLASSATVSSSRRISCSAGWCWFWHYRW